MRPGDWFQRGEIGSVRPGERVAASALARQPRLPPALWPPLVAILIALCGLAAPHVIPTDITLTTRGPMALLSVEGETQSWRWPGARVVRLAPLDPATHDWGIDGSEGLSASASTMDPRALSGLVATPYGAFDQSLYDEGGIGEVASAHLNGRAITARRLMDGVVLPRVAVLDLALPHLEAPAKIIVTARNGRSATITIDRSNRSVSISTGGATLASWYYPTALLPHLAPVLGQAGQSALWAMALYGLAYLLARVLAVPALVRRLPGGKVVWRWPVWSVATGLCVAGSFVGTLWVTLVDYNGMPHIQDTNAYVMQGRILASGRLFAPAPPDAAAFAVPFFGVVHGYWLGQYAPGNGLTIALGLAVGLPWLYPLCLAAGTVALIALVARRVYGPAAGAIAALLAALSPFHLFIAGSYLSHVPAAFFLTLSLYLLIRSDWGRHARLVALAGASIGAALFCRELSALLWGAPLVVALFAVAVRRAQSVGSADAARPLRGVEAFIAGGLPFLALYGLYNALATGSPLVSPRNILNPTDRYGFGPGHGWWSIHTLAAGFVNLEQQLTGLNLEALGWPIGATLGAGLLVLITGYMRPIDILLWIFAACVLAGAAGYFYNGVVYGPRYVYEALPPLLILIAGGLVALCRRLQAILIARGHDPRGASPAVGLVVALLFVPTVTMVLPRHLAFYRGYTALSWARSLPLQQLYHGAPSRAVVAVSDGWTYSNIVSNMTDPRNLADPKRTNGTVWAQASTPADYARLQAAFPRRTLYILSFDGSRYYFTPDRRSSQGP